MTCYWQLVGGHIRNLGTNLGIHWELDENKKIPTPPPHPPKEKKKKNWAIGCMLAYLIACQEFLCLPLLFSIFGQG